MAGKQIVENVRSWLKNVEEARPPGYAAYATRRPTSENEKLNRISCTLYSNCNWLCSEK